MGDGGGDGRAGDGFDVAGVERSAGLGDDDEVCRSAPSGGVAECEVARACDEYPGACVADPFVRVGCGVDDDGVVPVESAGEQSVVRCGELVGLVAAGDEVEVLGDGRDDVGQGDVRVGEVVGESGPVAIR